MHPGKNSTTPEVDQLLHYISLTRKQQFHVFNLDERSLAFQELERVLERREGISKVKNICSALSYDRTLSIQFRAHAAKLQHKAIVGHL